MIINGDSWYGLLAAYIGGPAAQADWLGPKVGGHLAPFLYSSREQSELSQWLCYDDSTINIVLVIIIIILLLLLLSIGIMHVIYYYLWSAVYSTGTFQLAVWASRSNQLDQLTQQVNWTNWSRRVNTKQSWNEIDCSEWEYSPTDLYMHTINQELLLTGCLFVLQYRYHMYSLLLSSEG